MIIFEKNLGKAPAGTKADYTAELTSEERSTYRHHLQLNGSIEAGIILPRSERLPQSHDLLQSADGTTLEIKAKAEDLVKAEASDHLAFAKACYHLGNRHLPLQIEDLCVYFHHDPVIEDLCRKLGFIVSNVQRPFEPEGGAYGAGHLHSHEHVHSHAHGHEQDEHHEHHEHHGHQHLHGAA